MNETALTQTDRDCLLELARRSISLAANGEPLPPLRLEDLPPNILREGASFVTLTVDGELRGCVGAIEPYQSLAEDVYEHAEAAAMHDYRFPPLQPGEVADICIEISYLTPPLPLEYTSPKDLISRLRPGVDGVMIRDGGHRATFLPQVWEKVPDPAAFLDHLCQKMGAPTAYWRSKHLQVSTYQVECFEEESRSPD
jgi:AmmeMemoRadiSam system protein A